MSEEPKPPLGRVKRQAGWWIYLILLLAFALRTYHLAYPAWDYHNWRQTITLMLARDFARHGFPLLHPQVAWIGNRPTDPSYFAAEFSIQSVLAALLYRLFGESDALARLVVIVFSLLGIYCLYDLLNRRAGPVAARLGAFIYAMLPYQLFFGRVFMPEIPAISLALAGLDTLDRWTDDRKASRLAAAGILTALAILQKPKVVIVALPMLYLFWLVSGRVMLRRREPYIFALIACLPELCWYAHAVAIEPQSVVSAINIPPELFAHHLELWITGPFLNRVLAALSREAFSPLGLVLALIGFFWPARGRAAWIFRLWIAGAQFLLLLIPVVIANNLYYLSLLLPGGAALAGLALAALARYRKARPAVAIVMAFFAAGALHSARSLCEPDRLPYDLGRLLNNLTEPGALVATETGGSPNVLYYADRRGWMLEREFDPARLESLKQAGARYYADTFAADAREHREFFRALDSRFARLTAEDAPWQIYDLAATPGPLRAFPAGEMQRPRTLNFGDQIRFRGIALHPLLAHPTCLEAIYHWQCVKAPSADWRAFVHVTNSAGQTVYQQDHWPQAGRFPTSKWQPGDLIRERYVLALPNSLPQGKYQVWLGWFDPVRGPRLPIRNPGAWDRDERALAATIEVSRPPSDGWFRVDP